MAETKGKPPALPFYVRDFLQSKRVRRMTLVQVAFYLFLLLESWDNDPVGYLPEGFEPWKLARAESKEDFGARGGQFVLECFEKDSQGRLYSARLVAIREEQINYKKQKSDSGKLGAEVRWQGRSKPPVTDDGTTDGKSDGDSMGEPMAEPMANEWPSSSSAVSSSACGLPSGRGKAPKRPFLVPPEAAELVEHLCERMLENNPRCKITRKQRAAWGNEARLMLERDHRDPIEVLAVIDWCQSDAFWRANILSLPKLREKFDQLKLKMGNGGTKGRTDGQKSHRQIEEDQTVRQCEEYARGEEEGLGSLAADEELPSGNTD